MKRSAVVGLMLLAASACNHPIRPEDNSVDGTWQLHGTAQGSQLTGTLFLIGDTGHFSGSADLGLDRDDGISVDYAALTVEGDRSEIRIGTSFRLSRSADDPRMGTWSCEGVSGSWSAWRAVE
jgi:hypothetical protein